MSPYQPPTEDKLDSQWGTQPRWSGIRRDYTADDVVRLRGSVHIECTLARRGAERLWRLLETEPYVHALGALTGNQAVQMVEAGLPSIYLSGWQVAADANLAGQMYPDQSLYPCNSAPSLVRAINNAFRRADQVRCAEGRPGIDYFVPIVADAEAGSWRRHGRLPRPSTRFTPASGSPTTARRRSTGGRSSMIPPLLASSASWGRWATSISSSPWPASTP
jgi:isocitrate lyase